MGGLAFTRVGGRNEEAGGPYSGASWGAKSTALDLSRILPFLSAGPSAMRLSRHRNAGPVRPDSHYAARRLFWVRGEGLPRHGLRWRRGLPGPSDHGHRSDIISSQMGLTHFD